MASILFWIFISFASLVGGAIIFAFLYLIFSWMGGWVIKKRIPLDKKVLADPGRPLKISEKEVKEDDRKDRDRYREFEKLRRLAENKNSGTGAKPSAATRNNKHERSIDLPSNLDSNNKATGSGASKGKRRVKLDR